MPDLARRPLQDLELEVLDHHHLVPAVAVEVVDLERGVAGQQAVARVGPAELPEDLAVEGDRRQATDLDEVVADPGDVLGDEHLGRAVAVEVAEADVPPGAELRGGELLPELGPRVLAAQLGELRLAPGDPGVDATLRLIGDLDAEVLEPRGDVRGDPGLAPGQLVVLGREDQPVVDVRQDLRALVLHAQAVIRGGVVRERRLAQLAPLGHAERVLERQPHRQAGPAAPRQREQVVMAVRVIPEDDPGHVVERQGPDADLDVVIAPTRGRR